MPTDSSPFAPRELALLDSVIAAVIRSRPMAPNDADDFRQTVYLRLVERRGDLFHRFRGDSSLRTYLFVSVRRMRFDWQNQTFGKWRPSLAARRGGTVAVALDRLINRDGYTVEEAIEHLRSQRRPVDPQEVRRLAATLPPRRVRGLVASELSERAQVVAFDDPLETAQEVHERCRRQAALTRVLRDLDGADRELLWLRFYGRLTVQAVAAQTQSDPRLLYRRFERILRVLRHRMLEQGVSGAV
jgi:RNA polymerase sigma factor (sigma-70 family)